MADAWDQFPDVTDDKFSEFPDVNPPSKSSRVPSDPSLYSRSDAVKNSALSIARQGARALGAFGRDFSQGALGLAATIGDAPSTIYNAGSYLAGSESRLPRPFNESLQALDSPEISAQGEGERLVSDATRGAGGAMFGLGIGGGLSATQSPIASRVGDIMSQAPMLQSLGGATGGLSSGVSRESGQGPVAQTMWGMAGGVVPAALNATAQGLPRLLVRGRDPTQMQENIRMFNRAGTTPTVGQASQNRAMQMTETALANSPGGSGPMVRFAQGQADDIGSGVKAKAYELSAKSSPEQAGISIDKGIRGDGGFVDKFKETQARLYDSLDQHIDSGKRVDVSNARRTLADLNADIPGAPATSKLFKNSRIAGIENALKLDTEGLTSVKANPEFAEAFKNAKLNADDAALLTEFLSDSKLPYEALKKVRTLVGREMADFSLTSDVPRSKWTALYGALSKDLEAAAKEAGPEATQAWRRANNYTRAGMERISQLESILDKSGGPEAVFTAAMNGTKSGASTIRTVMRSLPEESQKSLAAAVLQKMGTATGSNQNAAGNVFSMETFLTNFSNLHPDAKAALFDRFGPQLRQQIDDYAGVASNVREGSRVFRNPSGTAGLVGLGATGLAAGQAILSGNLPGAAAIASGVGGANLLARGMTNPNLVNWLASPSQALIPRTSALWGSGLLGQ